MQPFPSAIRLLVVLLAAGAIAGAAAAQDVYRGHGLAMHGDLKYPPDFRHFDYVNPAAPKGGTLNEDAIGGYDTFNPFVIKGRAGAGASQIYDTLMTGSADEPFSQYGLLAESGCRSGR